MSQFKKASEIDKSNKRAFFPEIRDVIISYLKNSTHPVTVTGTIIELNKYGLNPSRNIVKRYFDDLEKAGVVTVRLNGNVYEFTLIKKE
ncbi:MAG: hypothetical protein PHI15_08770 [Methanomicrobium sp.]|nr:hypothetical protein [Methanomicrobium sp.]